MDSHPLEDGLTIPEEINLREERKGALEKAKREMEKRYAEEKQEWEEAEKERAESGGKKQAMGFRQFLLRGLEKVNLEWELVCLSYNMKRLFRLSQG
jgi:hypothetical protein